MPAYVIDMRADRRWLEIIGGLKERLVSKLGDLFLKIIALSSLQAELYGSNVLVVVARDDEHVVESVMRSVVEVEGSSGMEGVISPLVVTPDERRIIEAFEGNGIVC